MCCIYITITNGNCLKAKLAGLESFVAVNSDAVFVQEGAVTLCLYLMMLWVLKTRIESETELKMFSSSSKSMGTQWGGEGAFLLLDTRMRMMPFEVLISFSLTGFSLHRNKKVSDADSPAIASRFTYGLLQQALCLTEQAQEQLLELG